MFLNGLRLGMIQGYIQAYKAIQNTCLNYGKPFETSHLEIENQALQNILNALLDEMQLHKVYNAYIDKREITQKLNDEFILRLESDLDDYIKSDLQRMETEAKQDLETLDLENIDALNLIELKELELIELKEVELMKQDVMMF